MARERDYAYEALAEATGTDMTAGRGELNAGLKSIRDQSEIEDSYLLADEIHTRARMYRQVMPDVMLTPTALAKHWLRVFEESNRERGTNLAPRLEPCATCNGDKFVLVSLRPPVQSAWMTEHGITASKEGIEEMAPCPDCNAEADTSFWRTDGTKASGLDPARVREMMSR
jgi:hypothetical protein